MSKLNQGRFHPLNPQKYVGNAANICYRSGWEFRMMRYFDRTGAVTQWSSEELRIPYVRPDDRQIHTYYPDFLIRVEQRDHTAKTFVVEVKPKRQCNPPTAPKTRGQRQRHLTEMVTFAINQSKFEAATKYCQKQGWTFLVITENEIFGHGLSI